MLLKSTKQAQNDTVYNPLSLIAYTKEYLEGMYWLKRWTAES